MRKIQKEADARLFFVIFRKNAASLRLLNTVASSHVYTIREDSFWHLALDSLGFLLWTRRQKIDTVIDLELFSRYTALLTGLSGAANRIGFYAFHNEGLYRGEMLTRQVAFNPHIHIAKNFIALVNATLAQHDEVPFSKTHIGDDEIQLARAQVDTQALRAMRSRIRMTYPGYDENRHRILLINPNASDLLPQRRWMPEHFVTVMGQLLTEREDLLVLITGSPNEGAEANTLKQAVGHERCVDFSGQITLEELPALYQAADLMLSNDSGPGHFSAVTSLRTFVLFGPETPRLYGSLGNSTALYAGLACSPCVSAWNHRKTACRDNVCLQVITPEQVLGHLRTALNEQGGEAAVPTGGADDPPAEQPPNSAHP
jgi:ADP-heptose:LPS heptosyltransferase